MVVKSNITNIREAKKIILRALEKAKQLGISELNLEIVVYTNNEPDVAFKVRIETKDVFCKPTIHFVQAENYKQKYISDHGKLFEEKKMGNYIVKFDEICLFQYSRGYAKDLSIDVDSIIGYSSIYDLTNSTSKELLEFGITQCRLESTHEYGWHEFIFSQKQMYRGNNSNVLLGSSDRERFTNIADRSKVKLNMEI